MPANAGTIGTGALSGAATGTAILPGWGTAIGAVVGAGAGLIAYLIESGQDDAAAEIQRKAQEAYGSLDDSAIEKAAAQVLGPTKLAQIRTDPKYRAAQDDALASLKDISNSGGFNLQDRAVLNDRQNETAQADQRRRASNLESLSARGQAGGGTEIGMLIAGQQAAANRDSAAGMHAAADAQARSLKAIADRGLLAGQMENADYGRQADAARAQDSIDRFNNTSQYDRANDAYGRQLGMLDKQYGFANQNASNTRAAGARDAGFVQDEGRALDQAVTGFGRSQNATTTPTPTTPENPYPQPTQKATTTDSQGNETLDAWKDWNP